ncbi:hypothetical protein SS1G_11784 [Sclerotinia sclerotiorum 1980 UF-70]|uniref:FAD-binding domain-containing protein n=2 Tax=Sclerotinia sclerotiorum (strain ATCC 18683 / 1980 / Ss-1) TaxID=665079 RepID=A7F3D8_SCLS1|nr:hypothetical protein SS1G_11784 [Sclerotinia sclerotiorum 1980 UF-70]APA14382.1 hypothetical protein sscle_12g091520 [Sclerotinia sclerotiorum 1980 UF-70]EDN97259.1 hypothetical protein SS1G_11784 [Sclerotinia sclerotiorum 1980 UF-70]
MSSEIMTSKDARTMGEEKKLKVLIVGAGIVGLTLAQGCRENGIEFEIVERDEKGKRAQGWAITLHWCLRSLERTIGEKLSELIPMAAVDPALNDDDGNFLFLNARTAEPRYKIPPSKLRRRLDRQKIRNLLATDLDIHERKGLVKLVPATDSDLVTAQFSDGTESSATLIVGADGNNSVTRKCLFNGGPDYELTKLPVYCLGLVRPFTEEQITSVRAIDPLLFQGLDPETGTFMWYSLQGIIPNPDGSKSYMGLVVISWLIKDEIADAMPKTDRERVAYVKKRAEGYAEPLRSIVQDIPEDITTTPLRLSDWPCMEWDNWGGKVTLVGDAAHAMTMYRGEGANHGILDAALLIDQLKKVKSGEITQKEAIAAYEAEMRPRTHEAVLKSRQAALDAHDWEVLTENSPIIGGRFAPKTAFI